jgi:hypothetical protein
MRFLHLALMRMKCILCNYGSLSVQVPMYTSGGTVPSCGLFKVYGRHTEQILMD